MHVRPRSFVLLIASLFAVFMFMSLDRPLIQADSAPAPLTPIVGEAVR